MATIDTFLDIEPIDLTDTGIQPDSLSGEVAVITGSTSNVGLGYARAIAAAGGKVVITGRNEEQGKEAERVIELEYGQGAAKFVRCDVTQEADIQHLALVAGETYGKVDILINNAMNLRLNGPVLSSPVSELNEAFDLSGPAVMRTIQAFVPGMLERKHGVVVYSTTQFHYSPPMIGGAIYCAGKAVATSLTMSLANEIGPYSETGVGVFCMIPSGVGRMRPSSDPNRPAPQPSAYGFIGPIPPEANALALVYSILHAGKLHCSGISCVDAFAAMNFPYPHPEALQTNAMYRLNDRELTLVFRNMGPGFGEE